MASRIRPALFGLVIAALVALAVCAAPDGRERSEAAQFVGRFHPLVVHLPIALLLLVPLLEAAGMSRRWSPLRASAGFVLGAATAGALAASAFGWLLAWSGGYGGPLVTRHFLGGLFLCAACLACCAVRGRLGPGRLYGLILVFTIGLMVWTSHEGGSLTHGETYLTKYMPARLRRWLLLPPAPGPKAGAATYYEARVQPILEDNCFICHDSNKHKGGLRMDSYALLMKGGEKGLVIRPGDPKASELFVRITLARGEKKFMPTDGKRPLSADEVKVIEAWIAAGASDTLALNAVKGAPAIRSPAAVIALAPDYRPRLARIVGLEKSLGLRLAARSQTPTDGLILRTAGNPSGCDDAALAQLKPVADLIVEAELARTAVTDAGMKSVAHWPNLRKLDLSHTAIGPAGLAPLAALGKLETINLTETAADEESIAKLRRLPALKRIYSFDLRGKEPAQP
jgi:uncharacterized membrane protein